MTLKADQRRLAFEVEQRLAAYDCAANRAVNCMRVTNNEQK
jgi:hypothetical protein